MAKPISETPVLRGEDARRFIAAKERPRDPEAVKRERERVLRNYHSIKASKAINTGAK